MPPEEPRQSWRYTLAYAAWILIIVALVALGLAAMDAPDFVVVVLACALWIGLPYVADERHSFERDRERWARWDAEQKTIERLRTEGRLREDDASRR